MRILQLAPGLFPYHNTGVETYTYRLSQALRSRGHSVTVAAPVVPAVDQEKTGPPIETLPAVQTRFQGGEPTGSSGREVWNAFEKIVQRTNPELIHVQHLIHMGSATLSRLERQGIPFIVSIPDYWYLCVGIQRLCNGSAWECTKRCDSGTLSRPLRFAYKLLRTMRRLRRCVSLLSGITAPLVSISRRAAEIHQQAGVPSNRFIVQPWGIDVDEFKVEQSPIADQTVRFGFFGTVIPAKGVEVLVRAARLVRGEWTLDIFGHGAPSYIDFLQNLAADAPIRFHGGYNHRDVARLLASVDVVVVPSIWEEVYALVVQEAWAAGKMVIASSIGGLSERIFDGVNGYLFPAGNVDALAERMSFVAANLPKLSAQMRLDVAQRDTKLDAEEFEALYSWTVSNWGALHTRKVVPADWGRRAKALEPVHCCLT